ncbi:MAG TPA: hypothetical protein VJ850_02030 [Candidatus Limnocylindrales bacterium]|nr:hypothetical protein [Candidatus Limnocylindrales bacterium]
MPALTIEDRTGTGRPTGGITLPNVPDRITLRELIRLRVREEVARYNLRPSRQFQGLVQPDGFTATAEGYEAPRPRPLDWERQAAIAIDAFGRNGFFVLVNGKQIVDLDTRLAVADTHDVGFIKLTPLVGG